MSGASLGLQADLHHEDTKSTKKEGDGPSREVHSLACFVLFVSSWSILTCRRSNEPVPISVRRRSDGARCAARKPARAALFPLRRRFQAVNQCLLAEIVRRNCIWSLRSHFSDKCIGAASRGHFRGLLRGCAVLNPVSHRGEG